MRVFGIFLFGLVIVAGCNKGGAYFRAADIHQVEVDGNLFNVRRRSSFAEAERVSYEKVRELKHVPARAIVAIEVTTGCKVTHVAGDPAVIRGKLNCTAGPDVVLVAPGGIAACRTLSPTVITRGGNIYVDFDCSKLTPYSKAFSP